MEATGSGGDRCETSWQGLVTGPLKNRRKDMAKFQSMGRWWKLEELLTEM